MPPAVGLQTLSAPILPATLLLYNCTSQRWTERNVDLLDPPVRLDDAVCFIFVEDGKWFKGENSPQRGADRRSLLAPFQVPHFVANQLCTDLNGFFGCRSWIKSGSADGQEELESLTTWFRILTKNVFYNDEHPTPDGKHYRWHEMGFFTRWTGPNASRVLCIDTPQKLREDLWAALQTSEPIEFRDPFGMLRPLLDAILESCNSHTWKIANQVREVEKGRLHRPDFEKLQNLSRHACHLVEVQHVAIETLQQLATRQEKVLELRLADEPPSGYRIQAKEYMAFQLQMMGSLKSRSQASSTRLQGEIALAYNMLANTDSQIMKSITLLTMVFLPGTFISALFSTTFFDFENSEWHYSSRFWIYWAVSLPVTVAVVVGWWYWIGGSAKNIKAKLLRVDKRSRSF